MSEDSLTFFVEGSPIPKGRPRAAISKDGKRVHVFTPDRTSQYENAVRVHALRAMRINLWRDTRPSDRFEVHLIFDLADDRRRDLDNLAKAVLDSLQPARGQSGGTVLLDDWQVVQLSVCRRLYAARAGVWIHVARAEEMTAPLRETAPGNTEDHARRLTTGPGETPGAVGRLVGRNNP